MKKIGIVMGSDSDLPIIRKATDQLNALEIPDGGEIIAQKAVDILPGDTPEILQRRVMEQAEWILLPQAAESVCAKMIGE